MLVNPVVYREASTKNIHRNHADESENWYSLWQTNGKIWQCTNNKDNIQIQLFPMALVACKKLRRNSFSTHLRHTNRSNLNRSTSLNNIHSSIWYGPSPQMLQHVPCLEPSKFNICIHIMISKSKNNE